MWNVDTPEGMANAQKWMKLHIGFLKDGAVWFIPRSRSAYRINKGSLVAELMPEFTPDESTEKVFKAMGWTVTRPN